MIWLPGQCLFQAASPCDSQFSIDMNQIDPRGDRLAKLVDVNLRGGGGIADRDDGTVHCDKRKALAVNEREQVGVDDVGLRRDHAVREVLVCLQRAVLEELG